MIIAQLHENIDEFYITDNAISSFPKLRSQGEQVDVYIEGVVVMPTKELVDGFIGILASFVFNLAYPSATLFLPTPAWNKRCGVQVSPKG